jgi:pyruvate carboxylase
MKNNTIKLNENALRQIIAESVKKVIKEYVEGEQGSTDVYKWVPDTYVDYYLKANKYGDYSVLAGNKLSSIYPGKIIAVSTPEEAQRLIKSYGPCILKITASTEGVSPGRNCVLVDPDSVLNIERIA